MPISSNNLRNEYSALTVQSVKDISPNVRLLGFKIPRSFGHPKNIPTGCYLNARAVIDGKIVTRSYTPLQCLPLETHDLKTFSLLVKRYEKGMMSPHIFSLKAGDTLYLSNPIHSFKYVKNAHKTMGFVAAGAGITHPLQIIKGMLELGDETNITLLYQTDSHADVLLREEIERLAKTYSKRLQAFFYIATQSPHDTVVGTVQQITGYIDEDSIKTLLAPSVCEFVNVCGPDGFNEAMKEALIKTGHVFGESLYFFKHACN